MKIKTQKSGFTLVEIMSVVALIAILFVIFVPRLDFANNKVREAGLQSDFRSYQLAFEQVARQHSGFETFTKTVDGSEVIDQEAIVNAINSYLDKALQITYVGDDEFTVDMEDPWSDAYRFAYNEDKNACYIISDGPDKVAATSSLVADVEHILDGESDQVADDNKDIYALKVSYVGSEAGLSIQTVGFDSNIDR